MILITLKEEIKKHLEELMKDKELKDFYDKAMFEMKREQEAYSLIPLYNQRCKVSTPTVREPVKEGELDLDSLKWEDVKPKSKKTLPYMVTKDVSNPMYGKVVSYINGKRRAYEHVYYGKIELWISKEGICRRNH